MTSLFYWYLIPKHKETEYVTVYGEEVQQTAIEQ